MVKNGMRGYAQPLLKKNLAPADKSDSADLDPLVSGKRAHCLRLKMWIYVHS